MAVLRYLLSFIICGGLSLAILCILNTRSERLSKIDDEIDSLFKTGSHDCYEDTKDEVAELEAKSELAFDDGKRSGYESGFADGKTEGNKKGVCSGYYNSLLSVYDYKDSNNISGYANYDDLVNYIKKNI